MKRWLRPPPARLVRATALVVVLLTAAMAGKTDWVSNPATKPPRGGVINGVLVSLLEVQGYLGSVRAQAALGEAYDQGLVIESDRTASLYWYRRAAGNGHVGAQYFLGDRLYRNRDAAARAEGMSWWTKAAAAGHPDAQRQLAHFYSQVNVQPAEAVKWWRRMAASGETEATRRLAWALHTGWGVERDQQAALTLWRARAAHGSVEAAYYLGLAAAQGDGVPQDRAEAVRLWLKDRELPGRYWGKTSLALCLAYANGEGVPRDPVEATFWCHPVALSSWYDTPMTPELEAAGRNLATASVSTISIIEGRRDKAEALAVVRSLVPDLRTRAIGGDARAQYFLAEALTHRAWFDCNPKEAAAWYRRAAAQGLERAAKLVAQLKTGHLTLCTPRSDK